MALVRTTDLIYENNVAPSGTDNFAAGFKVGDDWRDTVTEITYNCLGDGVWVNMTDALESAKKANLNATTAPTVNDDVDLGYEIGSTWVDTTADKAYICVDNGDGVAVWIETTQAGGGGGTNLSIGTKTATTVDVNSDTGTDATIPAATITEAGLLQATDKVKLNNTSGTNTGDQTSIVGITGTKAQFDTAVTDGDIVYAGDTIDADNVDDSTSAHKFVTAADLTTLSNTSGVNTGDEVSATNAIEGIVELATQGEVNTGTDTTRVVTPDTLEDKTYGIFTGTIITDNSTLKTALQELETASEAADKLSWAWTAGIQGNVNIDRDLERSGKITTNMSQFVVPFASELKRITIATSINETWTAHIYKNEGSGAPAGASIASLASGGAASAVSGDLSVSLAAGDTLRIRIENRTGPISDPSVTIILKET